MAIAACTLRKVSKMGVPYASLGESSRTRLSGSGLAQSNPLTPSRYRPRLSSEEVGCETILGRVWSSSISAGNDASGEHRSRLSSEEMGCETILGRDRPIIRSV